ARTISDDGRIVSPSRAMRLLASASRSPWRITMRLSYRDAAWTNLAAGRACRPAGSLTMSRRSGMSVPRELGHRGRSLGGGGDLCEGRTDAGLDGGEDRPF